MAQAVFFLPVLMCKPSNRSLFFWYLQSNGRNVQDWTAWHWFNIKYRYNLIFLYNLTCNYSCRIYRWVHDPVHLLHIHHSLYFWLPSRTLDSTTHTFQACYRTKANSYRHQDAPLLALVSLQQTLGTIPISLCYKIKAFQTFSGFLPRHTFHLSICWTPVHTHTLTWAQKHV